MRDINPDPYGPRERSIRNVPIGHGRGRSEPRAGAQHDDLRPRRHRRPLRRRALWGLVGLLVAGVAAGALISVLFAGAKVTLSARAESVTLPATLTALRAPASGLAYQVITVTRAATTTAPATGTKQVSRQASGIVTIENKYSSASQRLIANTRFEAPDGKIYRIRDSITVPGTSRGAPGSASATIYADSPGESYNRAAGTIFTIPGFRGDPRYTAFSARADGPVSGGFVGTEPAVAQSDLSKAQAELRVRLEREAENAAQTAVPSGFALVPGTLAVTYGAHAAAPALGGTAAITQSAQATAAVVSLADLARAIAYASVKDYAGEAVLLDPSSQLLVHASSTDLTAGTLTLGLSGAALLVWQFDPAAVGEALAGTSRTQFEAVLQSFAPAVRCSAQSPCEASIRPFWHSSFPADPQDIDILVRVPK